MKNNDYSININCSQKKKKQQEEEQRPTILLSLEYHVKLVMA